MPNTIKYSVTGDTQSLKKYEMYIGVGDVPKGPTSETNHYNGIVPPTGGYVIYLYKGSDGPSIYVASNAVELITITNLIIRFTGYIFTTTSQCRSYFLFERDKMLVNRTYESIITSDLALMLDAGFLPSYPAYSSFWLDMSYRETNGYLINGPNYSSSDGGGSIVLDGVNDYIDLQKGTIQNQTYGNYTFSLWWSPNSNITSSNPNNYMFFEAQNTLLGGVDNYLYILGSTGGRFGFQMFNPLSTIYSTTNNWVAGTWYNITCTYNITTSKQSLYVNGVLESSTTIANCYINTNSYFSLGAYSSPSKIWFAPIKISNFMIYLKTLSDTEILQNYNALKTRYGL